MAWIRRELDALGIPPLKRFGQHFLVDRKIREELVDSAALTASDTVLEVGPGLGFLTTHLAGEAGHVIAVEKDRTLAKYLKKRLAEYHNVTVIEGDVLTTAIPDYTKIVSSPPYNISSKLILLILKSNLKLAALLLQQEFARRLTSSSGSRDYGRLSVMFQCKAQAKLVKDVPRSAFYPKPRVDSVLVTITPVEHELPIMNREFFENIVRSLFTQRRRRLRGVMIRFLKAQFPDELQLILQRTTFPEKRVFEMTPRELVKLSNEISVIVDTIERVGD